MIHQAAEKFFALAVGATTVSAIPVASSAPTWLSIIGATVAFFSSVAAIVAIYVEKKANQERHRMESEAAIERNRQLQNSLATIQINQKLTFSAMARLEAKVEPKGE